MQVIKFGGTSVGSVEALENVLKIVKQKKQSQTPLVVVCSAFSKVTDLLINAAVLAAKKDDSYTEILAQIKERHLSVIAHFLVKNKTICTTETNALLDELTEITKGIFLLKQLPLQEKDLVISFGERLSNTIV